jgi:hypothetical protein
MRTTIRGSCLARHDLINAALTTLVFGLLCSACYTLHPLPSGDVQVLQPRDRLWVTRADHSTVAISAPQLMGDTVFGMVNGVREHFLLSDTVRVGTRELAPARTAAVVLASAAGVGAFVYLNFAFLRSLDYTPPGKSPVAFPDCYCSANPACGC